MSFFKLPDQKTVYYDIDDTLVLYNMPATAANSQEFTEFVDEFGRTFKLKPHKEHIESLIKHKKAGANIIVWSAGGSDWAASVVKKLELSDYVDIIINKPSLWYDDLTSEDVLPKENRKWETPK